MTRITSRLVASVALCGAFFSTSAASADEPNHAIVRFADLDLTTDAGAGVLNARIRHATQKVCGVVDQRDLRAVNRMMACRQVALNSARPQMELALANARTGATYAQNDTRTVAAGF